MSKKVAKLVYFSMMTRVIVDENATDQEIVNKAKSKIMDKVANELHENLEDINDDIECPCGEFVEDVYYQPNLNHPKVSTDDDFYSFMVYRDAKNAQIEFPGVEIIQYADGDIENPVFMD